MSIHEYTKESETVIAAEKAHILEGREEAKLSGKQDEFTGLAFSGGGIRSASFCLGVLQALVRGGVMKKIDYLSTASGGGYLGSSLTWFLRMGLPGGGTAGTDPENFPFGRAGAGARNQQKNPNAILDFLRQHGCYLTPNNGLDFVSFTGYALRTILVSLLVYFSLATLLMLLLQYFDLLDSQHGVSPLSRDYWYFGPGESNNLLLLQAALVLLGLFALLSIVGGVFSRLTRSYSLRVYNQEVLGLLLKLTGLCVLLGSLPLVKDLLDGYFSAHIGAAGGSTLIGTAIGWYRYYSQQKAARPKVENGGGMTPIIAAGLIIYGLALGAFILADVILRRDLLTLAVGTAALVLTGLVLGWLVNINQFSLHRMYRDRLMETFTPDLKSVEENSWGMATEADKALLEDMCQPPNRRPYHLINANLVLSDSETAKYRGRGGDNFLLSPLYCGSDATGWRKSSVYMRKLGGRGGLTLATAMAISGAALNPNAGNSGRGVTRNPWVSILYTLLNLRLGYWMVNPRKEAGLKTANFLVPGLMQSIIGNVLNFGLKETQPFLELTDGGHFDNLGLYELIRRRLKTIVVCDGGADEKFTFDDLANAIERVRVDFGARIQFKDPDFDLSDVLPGSAGDTATDVKYQNAKRGFAVASISYADGSEGVLIYIKATMIRGLSTDLYSYKAAHPAFPHEPTLDQFFDEVQIEAYRELGYYLGWQFLEANGAKKQGGNPAKAPWI